MSKQNLSKILSFKWFQYTTHAHWKGVNPETEYSALNLFCNIREVANNLLDLIYCFHEDAILTMKLNRYEIRAVDCYNTLLHITNTISCSVPISSVIFSSVPVYKVLPVYHPTVCVVFPWSSYIWPSRRSQEQGHRRQI